MIVYHKVYIPISVYGIVINMKKIKLRTEDGDIMEYNDVEEFLQDLRDYLKIEYWDGWQWI